MYHHPSRRVVSAEAADRLARRLNLTRLARKLAGRPQPSRDVRSRFGPVAKAARELGAEQPRTLPQPFADAGNDNDRVIPPILFPHQRDVDNHGEGRRA